MRFTVKLIGLLLLVFSVTDTSAQEDEIAYALILSKSKGKEKFHYHVGNNIAVEVDGNFTNGNIRGITKDSLWIDTLAFLQSEPDVIYITDRRHFIRNLAYKLPSAGVVYFMITSINSVIAKSRPIFIREHLVPVLGLIGSGLIFQMIKYKTCDLNRKWKLVPLPI